MLDPIRAESAEPRNSFGKGKDRCDHKDEEVQEQHHDLAYE